MTNVSLIDYAIYFSGDTYYQQCASAGKNNLAKETSSSNHEVKAVNFGSDDGEENGKQNAVDCGDI